MISIPGQYEDFVMLSDANKIRQVLTNFVANAVKYTIEGSVTLGFELQDGLVEFYVTDTGIGIPEKNSKEFSSLSTVVNKQYLPRLKEPDWG